ncbi:MAG: 3-dehydroquinate synthase [Caldilineales bacterium]
MHTQNIVLAGFMGSGKSVVGRVVAERLGRWFVDTDAVIEQQAGRSVTAIFAEQGETAFRLLEAEVCRSLGVERNLVIAAGGGALLTEANRSALAANGVLICLHASVDTLLQRLAATQDRPLLAGADRRARVESLLAQRATAYAVLPHHIDTDGLSVDQVADAVIRVARQAGPGPVRLEVTHPQGMYPLLIGEGLLAAAGTTLAQTGLRPARCAVVSQPAIAAAHGERLMSSLRAGGFDPVLLPIPAGEAHKTLETVATLYDAFLAAELDRHSPVVALGGGVVGDVAGFAAASYLRGVPFVQIPTSLLAMVDASVGGKTGVDLPQGKNLVGAFKQPALVLLDVETLQTLPSAEFRSGLAEIVKHGIIGDPGLFEVVEGSARLTLEELVTRAVQVKIAVVQQDPFEQGRRAVLNLGHTFGHALETLSHYTLRHGEAVSIGLVMAAYLAARLELCAAELPARVESALARLGLPVRAPGFAPQAVLAAMQTDKKRAHGRLRFVLPRAIGDVALFGQVTAEDVLAVLAALQHPA